MYTFKLSIIKNDGDIIFECSHDVSRPNWLSILSKMVADLVEYATYNSIFYS